MTVRTVLLVRHAADDRRGPDPGLTAAGLRQAAAVADRLSAEPITAVWTSPARRALDTATTIASRVSAPVFVSESLTLPGRAGAPRFPDPVGPVTFDHQHRQAEERGGRRRLLRRRRHVDGAVSVLLAGRDDPLSVAVTHGEVIDLLLTAVLATRSTFAFALAHASVSRIDLLDDGRRFVRSVNETGHLTPG